MKIIVIGQGKGGVGKTASAAHIAFYAQEAGLRVLAGDLDTGDLSKTLNAYRLPIPASSLFVDNPPENLAPKHAPGEGCLDLIGADNLMANVVFLPMAQAQANFASNLSRFADDYDLCVIDTAPGMGVAKAAAFHIADAVLSPVEMEVYSLEGLGNTLRAILNARQRNPKLAFLGILPSRVDRRNPRQVRNLEQLQQAQAANMAPLVIGLRSSVAEALALGMPVWKLRKSSARVASAEMRALGEYVLSKMGVVQ